MSALKKFLSALFTKETLTKIFLVQIIVLLFMAMSSRGLHVYLDGSVDLGSSYGGVDLNIKK
ncbi:hypothetical protein D3C76_963080 [compost metagenome]